MGPCIMTNPRVPATEADQLLPCPFCGEHAAEAVTHAAGHSFYGVDCQGCGAQVHESDPQRAVLVWNKRHRLAHQPSVSREAVAEIVFEAMKWAADQSCTDNHPTWVPRGNSYAQDRARDAARAILALASSAPAKSESPKHIVATRDDSGLREADPETLAGHVICHSSDGDGIPDVGVSVGLGNGCAIWIGELLKRDGGDVGVVFHGPNGQRIAAPLFPDCEWQHAADLFHHHLAPAIAALATNGGAS